MREQAKYWNVPEYDDLELLRATFVTHSFARHIHEGFAVGIVEDGLEGFYYRRTHHIAGQNQVVMINPGEIHTGHAARSGGWWQYRMFYPSVELMQSIVYELTGKHSNVPFFGEAVVQDDHTAALLRQAHIALETSDSALERGTLLRLALGQLISRYAIEQPQPAQVQRSQQHRHEGVRLAQVYLETHFQENVDLETLAEIAGLSPFHLARVFQKQIGLPPHTYLTHLRVQHARKLIPQGMPLVDVALEAGFADQSHFTRWFKRIVGVTPGQYTVRI